MNFFEIIGVLAGILVAVPTIPQIIRTLKTKNVNWLSTIMYLIRASWWFCWIIYGWMYMHSRQMQIFNTISTLLSLSMVFLIRKYRKN